MISLFGWLKFFAIDIRIIFYRLGTVAQKISDQRVYPLTSKVKPRVRVSKNVIKLTSYRSDIDTLMLKMSCSRLSVMYKVRSLVGYIRYYVYTEHRLEHKGKISLALYNGDVYNVVTW